MKRCPISYCDRNVSDRQVMCPKHWKAVPEGLRSLIHRYKRKRDTDEWKRSIEEAIRTVSTNEAVRRELDAFVSWWKGD